jgi:hypothetical protein
VTQWLATVLFAGPLLIPANDDAVGRREVKAEERAAVSRWFAVSYPDETILGLEGDDLDGPFPAVTVLFRERERTQGSRLLQAVDCRAFTEVVGQGAVGPTLRPSLDVWECGDQFQVVVLDREIPVVRVSIRDGISHELTERFLALARSLDQFVALTAVDRADDGRYALHYTRRDGFGVRSVDPTEVSRNAPP